EAVAEGRDGAQEGLGLGGEVAGEDDSAGAVEDDEEEGPGVQIDAGVESGGGGRRKGAHGEGLRLACKGGGWVLPPSSPVRAFMSIQSLHLTGPPYWFSV